jgi:hypothetical protein
MMSWNDISCVLRYKDSNNVDSEIHYFKDGLIPLFCSVQPCCSEFYGRGGSVLILIFSSGAQIVLIFTSYSLYSRGLINKP